MSYAKKKHELASKALEKAKGGRKTPVHLKERNQEFVSKYKHSGGDVSSMKSKERKLGKSVGQDYKFH